MKLKQASAGALAAATLFVSGWLGGSQSASTPTTAPPAIEAQSVADTENIEVAEIGGIGLEALCNGTPMVCVPSYLFTPTPIVPMPDATASRTPIVRPTATPTRGSPTPTPVMPAAPTITTAPTNTSACGEYPCITDVDFTYEVIRRVALCFTASPCGSGEMNIDRYRFRDVGELVSVKCLIEYTRGGNLWANEHPCSDNPNGRWSAVIHNGIQYMKFVGD